MRATGILTAVLVLFVFAAYGREVRESQMLPVRLEVFAIASLSMGIFPFLLMLNRAEQDLVAIAGLFSFLTLKYSKRPFLGRLDTILGVLFALFLTIGIVSVHSKGIALAPLCLVCGYFIGRKGWAKIVTGSLQLVIFWEAYTYYAKKYDCPEWREYNALVQAFALHLPHSLSEIPTFLNAAIQNLLEAISCLGYLLFASQYKYEWLPGFSSNVRDFLDVLNGMIILATSIGIGLLLYALFRVVRFKVSLNLPNMLGLGGLMSLGLLSIFQSGKDFYFLTAAFPLFVLAGVSLADKVIIRLGRVARVFGAAVVILSLLSSISILCSLAPRLVFNTPPIVASYSPPIMPLTSGIHDDEIVATSALCDFSLDGNTEHLIFDLYTYFPLRRTFAPFHIGGITPKAMNGDFESIRRNLHSLGSPGAVVRRTSLPPSLVENAKCNGDFCCLRF
jgi:hypothetical protein